MTMQDLTLSTVLSSLDLANKQMLTGSIRLVYTITYTLFLAFCLILGSDIFFLIDPSAKNTAPLSGPANTSTTVNGSFLATTPAPEWNVSAAMYNSFNGSFTFDNSSTSALLSKHLINGCYRDPAWPLKSNCYRVPLDRFQWLSFA